MNFKLIGLGILGFGLSSSLTAALWSFDEVKGRIIPADRSEFNAVVAVDTGNKILSDGLFGKALSASAVKAHGARVEHRDELDLVNDFTIRCVFRPGLVVGYRTLIWKGNRTMEPQQINYYVSLHDGKPEFKFKDAVGEWHVFTSGQSLIKSGQWCDLVVTMDRAGVIKGYLNGEPCFAQKYVPGRLTVNRQPVFIGMGQNTCGTVNYPFDGLIDEIRISKGVAAPTAADRDDFSRRCRDFAVAAVRREAAGKDSLIKALTAYGDRALPAAVQMQKMTLPELTALKKQYDYVRSYADFYSRNKGKTGMAVTTLNTAERIVDLNDYLSGKRPCRPRIELFAARNEREGFQIILMGRPDRTIDGVRIELPVLQAANGGKAVIPAHCLEWGELIRITSELPEYPVDYVGTIPDAIMEGQSETVSVPVNGFTPVYVRVGIGAEVATGDYTGTLKVISGDQVEDVAVKLHVYDFTLPVTTSCKVIFSFFEHYFADWYGIKNLTDKQKMAIYDFLLKYRISPNNIYSSNIYPELKFMPELMRKGANFCTLGYVGGKNTVPAEELDRKLASFRQRVAAVDKAGLAEVTYLYAFDELWWQPAGTKEASRQFMTAFKQALPAVKTIQTSLPEKSICADYDIFVPLFQTFMTRQDIIAAGRKAGKTLWWYAADDPHKPYPNFFLDYPVLDNRIIFTLSYMYGIEGVLYWCINREWATNMDNRGQWPAKPWKPYIISVLNHKRQFKNGMGNYVYPGKDGRILPSLRLENLRDGIEDYEYLMLLKNAVERLRKARTGSKLLSDAEALLRVPPEVAVSVGEYSADPAHLQRYRDAVAAMIERINHDLQFLTQAK